MWNATYATQTKSWMVKWWWIIRAFSQWADVSFCPPPPLLARMNGCARRGSGAEVSPGGHGAPSPYNTCAQELHARMYNARALSQVLINGARAWWPFPPNPRQKKTHSHTTMASLKKALNMEAPRSAKVKTRKEQQEQRFYGLYRRELTCFRERLPHSQMDWDESIRQMLRRDMFRSHWQGTEMSNYKAGNSFTTKFYICK